MASWLREGDLYYWLHWRDDLPSFSFYLKNAAVLDVLYAMHQLIIRSVTYIFIITSLKFLFFWSKLRSIK